MDVLDLERALTDERLEQSWRDCLAEWASATSEQRSQTLAWVHKLRDDLLRLAADVQDPEEIEMSVAIRYIELKSHWMMLNTLIQYEVFRRGDPDLETAYRASVVTGLLAALEPLLTPEDIETITRFLSEPIGRRAA